MRIVTAKIFSPFIFVRLSYAYDPTDKWAKMIFTLRKEGQNLARVRSLNPEPKKKSRPPLTAEGKEKQMISLAIDCAEKQLREGTASSQVITHYLKLASSKNELEMEKLRKENELLRAKTEAIKSAKSQEELYAKAIAAIRLYSGVAPEDENL